MSRIDRMSLILRRKRAAAAAKAAGVESLLVTHLPDVRWLSGFTGSNAALLLEFGRKGLAAGRAVLFTDGRYTTQAKAEAAGMKVVMRFRRGQHDRGGSGQHAQGAACRGAAEDV